MEKKIILTTKGNISVAEKKHLRENGVVVAEVKDMNSVKVISGADFFDIDDISLSAIQAINASSHDSVRNGFADRLTKKIIDKAKPTIPTNQ